MSTASTFLNDRAIAPPAYRDRLRLEGLTLAGAGAVAIGVVVVAGSPRLDLLFAVQLVLGVGLLAWLGPRSARKNMAAAAPVTLARAGSGEPTPLWHVMALVAVLTPLFWLIAGPISGLSFATGAGLVGLTQAFVLAPVVAGEEARTGRRYIRLAGSRLLRGTKLGWLDAA